MAAAFASPQWRVNGVMSLLAFSQHEWLVSLDPGAMLSSCIS